MVQKYGCNLAGSLKYKSEVFVTNTTARDLHVRWLQNNTDYACVAGAGSMNSINSRVFRV